MGTMTKEKRKQIETMVVSVFDKLDETGDNAKRYREEIGAMSDVAFEKWVKKFGEDENNHFYLSVLPYHSEPNLEQIEAAAKVTGTQLHEYIYFRHDGAVDDPVRTAQRVPVGLTAY